MRRNGSKFLATQALVVVLLGCNSPSSESVPESSSSDSTVGKLEPNQAEGGEREQESPRDKYINDFAGFVASVAAVVQSINDSDSAEAALGRFSELEDEATQLGQKMEQLQQAAKSDEEREQLIRYIQDELKSKAGTQLKEIQAKLGRSKASSAYPKVWEAGSRLMNAAKKS